MGFSYEIQYKKGVENIAVDALSRTASAEVLCLAFSVVQSDMSDMVRNSYTLDPGLTGMVNGTKTLSKKYQLIDGFLRRKGKLVVGPD